MSTGMRPNQSYNIGLIIGEDDYSAELRGITIVSSLSSYYPVVKLRLRMDPEDVILKKIYGQIPMTLIILLKDYSGTPALSTLKFELIHVSDNTKLGIKQMISAVESDGGLKKEPYLKDIEVITILKEPFKTMTSLVNDVKSNIMIQDLISELVIKNTTANLNLDVDDINLQEIDQVCIPPSTVINTFKYLDNTFGIYNGASAVFCDHNNILKVFNLSHRIKTPQTYTIVQVASDSNNKELDGEPQTIKRILKGELFYTFTDVEKKYKANTQFTVSARTLRHIVKPKDRLSYVMEIDLKNVASIYGVVDNTNTIPDLFLNDDLVDHRVHYYINHTGNDLSPTFIHANQSKPLSNLFTIKMVISGFLYLTNLLNVGEPVKFESKILEYVQFTGKYILFSSALNFYRDTKDWAADCLVTLGRTNKSLID